MSGLHDSLQRVDNVFGKLKALNTENLQHLDLHKSGYTTIISNLTRGNQKGAARLAEKFVNEIKSKYDGSDLSLKPLQHLYGMVCDAYAKQGHVKNTFAVHNQMVQLYEEGGDEEMKPTIINYTTILNALANSNDRDAVTKVSSTFVNQYNMEYFIKILFLTSFSCIKFSKGTRYFRKKLKTTVKGK